MPARVNRKQRTARILQLWRQGLAVGQIALRLGMSASSISASLNHAGVDRSRRSPRRITTGIVIEGSITHTPPRYLDHGRD